jgi:aspartyl-tRNA(Asn)/glutamyl-tRNA(Gln) amidotransferase subunit A
MAELTCTAAAAALRSGERSPLDLVEYCLSRIDRFDSQVHAWVLVDADGARAQARLLADELARGFDRGPLHGIPIGIKDIIDVEGLPTLAGSPLRAGHQAARDAELVARLRRAGAMILGKTVTCEFACFDPSPTRNPWNLDRTPGGSSSGSAAAVAMGMCLAAVGTQTGGSITRPASYCGVAGCKPAYGAIPLDGVLPVSRTLDHAGAIARTVDDLDVMIEVMSGQRIARIDDDQPNIVEVDPNSFDEAVRMHRRIMVYEAAHVHRDQYPVRRTEYGPKIAAMLDEGFSTSQVAYREAIAYREQFRAKIFDALEQIDAFTTPATIGPAGDLETTGDSRFNSPWSFAGVPTVSIPCGLTDDGMPIGLQLIGHPERIDRLFAAARWCERRIAFDKTPPLL